MELLKHELKAVEEMHNGCILCGGVGSGKTITSLAYYYKLHGGDIYSGFSTAMKKPCDLYIITTPKKRDTLEWDEEILYLGLSQNPDVNRYGNKVVIDSWNNIKKYRNIRGAFFIFDEQRVVGYGAWSRNFIKIAKSNQWILLSATPGDRWEDYIPVFIANGFFRSKQEFIDNHVVYDRRITKFPKIDRYLDTQRLARLRDRILVTMDFERKTVAHHEDIFVRYDSKKYRDVLKYRWNETLNKPIESAPELCMELRKVVYTDESRQVAFMRILEDHPKSIVFYNYNFELEIIKDILDKTGIIYAEWNGFKHQPIPDLHTWVYLVQYNAGAEGWNCIKTDTIIFFSENYSYKIMQQACGRIDRMNTPYTDLYYYHIRCQSGIDLAVHTALAKKKKFNESAFIHKRYKLFGSDQQWHA